MNMLHWLRITLALPLFALLIGCATTPEPSEPPAEPAEWPSFAQPQSDENVFRVDSSASEVLVRVDPEGPMARMGHSHVVGGPVLSGIVVTGSGIGDARLDLEIDVAAIEVDRPQWRRAQGLKPELDADAINGTRDNLRSERVLNVSEHPAISIRSVAVTGPDWIPTVTARIRLRGEIREVAVPVAVTRSGQTIQAIGQFEVLQSDFGIEPFSAAGGALRVSDRMQIRFRIVARNRS